MRFECHVWGVFHIYHFFLIPNKYHWILLPAIFQKCLRHNESISIFGLLSFCISRLLFLLYSSLTLASRTWLYGYERHRSKYRYISLYICMCLCVFVYLYVPMCISECVYVWVYKQFVPYWKSESFLLRCGN